jgi:hypothetical protein
LAQPGSPFAKYIRTYKTLKAIEIRTNMTDEEIIVDETTATQIDETEKLIAAQNSKADADAKDVAGAHAIADLVNKLPAKPEAAAPKQEGPAQ